MNSRRSDGWTLFSPVAPTAIESPEWGASLGVNEQDRSLDGFHEGGWYLSEAECDGWKFGVSQDRLCSGRIHAFLRAPNQEELSVVVDHRHTGVSSLSVPCGASYAGAILLGAEQPIASRAALVQALLSGLPKLKEFFQSATPRADA